MTPTFLLILKSKWNALNHVLQIHSFPFAKYFGNVQAYLFCSFLCEACYKISGFPVACSDSSSGLHGKPTTDLTAHVGGIQGHTSVTQHRYQPRGFPLEVLGYWVSCCLSCLQGLLPALSSACIGPFLPLSNLQSPCPTLFWTSGKQIPVVCHFFH